MPANVLHDVLQLPTQLNETCRRVVTKKKESKGERTGVAIREYFLRLVITRRVMQKVNTVITLNECRAETRNNDEISELVV